MNIIPPKSTGESMNNNHQKVNEKMANGNMDDTKPAVLEVIPENIPEVLKSINHWVVFRLVKRGEKWTKPPYDAKTGNDAKVNDSNTWSDFATAYRAYQTGKYDGIGIVLTDDMGITGFDFDHCIENNVINPEVRSFMDILKTYTEKSPSGTGIRAFALGTPPGDRTKSGPYEVYSKGRYLTVTGHFVTNAKDTAHREKEIAEVYRKIFGNQKKEREPEPAADTRKERSVPSDMQSLLEKAFASKCGSEIQSLYSGNWKQITGCPSQSEADQKLCCHLAFWFDRDSSAIDAAFRASGLFREKWDRKTGKTTYGQMTIDRAVSTTKSTYQDFMREKESTGERNQKAGNKEDTRAGSDNGKPENKSEWTPDQWMEELNRKHAVVMLGGKLAILNEGINPITKRPDVTFSAVNDFKGRYANHRIMNPDTKRWIRVGEYWFSSKDRREYDDIVFSPDAEIEGCYNLWRGFCIKPKPGDWGLMYQHIRDVICGGNEEYLKWLLAWFARIVQDPGGERPGTAVILKGKKGTGKGAFLNQFKYIFGNHFLAPSRQEHITGRFNTHLKDVLLLFCDEGFWAGNKSDEGVLKQLITEPHILVEPKGKDAFTVTSHVNIVMSSNEAWVVPASRDERRYFVLDVSDVYLREYSQEDRIEKVFRPLWEQMNNGGREAMFHDLLHLDISDVNLRVAPRTLGLWEQMKKSNDPFEQWWRECLAEGVNTQEGIWAGEVDVQIVYQKFKSFMDDIAYRGRRMSDKAFGTALRKLCPVIERKRGTFLNETNQRPYFYKFPALEQCRAEYEDSLNIKINWEEEI